MFTHYFKVGAGVLAAAAILIIGYNRVQEMRLDNDNSYALKAVFSNVQGLSAGNAVWLSGISIGKVESLELMDNGDVMLNLRIEKKYKIHKESQFTIKVGFLEDKVLNIEAPRNVSPPYTYFKDGEIVRETKSPATVPDIIDKANTALEEMNLILAKTRVMMESERIQNDVFATTENVRRITEEALKFTIAVRQTGDTGSGKVVDTLENARVITENLKATSLKIDSLITDVDRVVLHTEDILGDELFKNEIKQTVYTLKKSLEHVEESTRAIRDLVTDTEINQDIRETIKTTRATMENADKAASSFTKMIRAINNTEFRPDFGLRYEGRKDKYYADMNVRVFPPNSEVFYLFGFDDLGENSMTNLQFGVKGFQPDMWYKFGVKSGKLGGGFEYQKNKNYYIGEISDPNDLQVNLRAGRAINENLYYMLGWESFMKENSASFGLLQRY
jgi:phospholipid/cholesterol/gamma-HCH transport system substrate-binding protein